MSLFLLLSFILFNFDVSSCVFTLSVPPSCFNSTSDFALGRLAQPLRVYLCNTFLLRSSEHFVNSVFKWTWSPFYHICMCVIKRKHEPVMRSHILLLCSRWETLWVAAVGRSAVAADRQRPRDRDPLLPTWSQKDDHQHHPWVGVGDFYLFICLTNRKFDLKVPVFYPGSTPAWSGRILRL